MMDQDVLTQIQMLAERDYVRQKHELVLEVPQPSWAMFVGAMPLAVTTAVMGPVGGIVVGLGLGAMIGNYVKVRTVSLFDAMKDILTESEKNTLVYFVQNEMDRVSLDHVEPFVIVLALWRLQQNFRQDVERRLV